MSSRKWSYCQSHSADRLVHWYGGGTQREWASMYLFNCLNERVCRKRHPLFTMDQTLVQLTGAKVDANSGAS